MGPTPGICSSRRISSLERCQAWIRFSIAPISAAIAACLRLDVNRLDPKNPDRKKINALAETLVDCALKDRESWAFQQIADRLEGKPVQVVDATVDDHRAVHEFSDAELTAILRRRVGVVAVESEEERPESGALN
jgi:hypothetical protein